MIVTCKDGSTRCVAQTGAMASDLFLAIYSDLTERKKAEESLRISQAQLSDAADLAHIVYWEADPESEEFIFNDPFYALFGTTAEREGGYRILLAEYPKRFVHPDDLERYYSHVQQTDASRPELTQFEHRILRQDGEVRHILNRSRFIRDAEGRVVRVYGANQDITERKVAEEALRWKTTFLEALVDSSHDGILILDNRMQKVLQNERLVEMWKMPQDIAETEDEEQRIKFLMTSIRDPREFYGKLVHLNNHGDEVIRSEFELKDGTVVDTFSYPVTSKGSSEQYGRIWTFRDVTEVRRYWDMLENLSTIDGLTEISNRRRFDEFLEQEWRRSVREQAELSLILMDIDYFKQFNDLYGHLSGDDCLKQVAAVLKRTVRRAGDVVARYGGEEFACVLPGTGKEGAGVIARRIADEITRLAIPHEGSVVADHVTLSFGLATIVPERGQEYLDLIAMADRSLYSAKQRGRNRMENDERQSLRSKCSVKRPLPEQAPRGPCRR